MGEQPPTPLVENRERSLPTVDEIFPFSMPLRREGEPEFPENLVDPELYDGHTTKQQKLGEWIVWSEKQPDHELLHAYSSSRMTVAKQILKDGAKTPANTDEQNEFFTRFFHRIAEGIREKGFGDILAQYYINNTELHSPPPPKRTETKYRY